MGDKKPNNPDLTHLYLSHMQMHLLILITGPTLFLYIKMH